MISPQLARALQLSGLKWRPTSGDIFMIDREGFEGDTFTVSDMTIEAHEFETGTVLGFNGTTEWALDSVSIGDALWMPAEHQLRALLGSTFRALRALRRVVGEDPTLPQTTATDSDSGLHPAGVDDDGLALGEGYEVETVLRGESRVFVAADAADAYAGALLELIGASTDALEPDLG